ncbi:hypothetical protein [Alkalinema sp. FACHB-956]|uniref:hypothetical protein n=1 Tax=Alkalinema sp. FACHB-956 TaxID=2692768 RepID=UPI00168241E8|nr:hypothetical protein [Alkalinema sp. FACHB-956]MBD2327344.1 hypothetical protein [Alkalinema sp. FACHB-956]
MTFYNEGRLNDWMPCSLYRSTCIDRPCLTDRSSRSPTFLSRKFLTRYEYTDHPPARDPR